MKRFDNSEYLTIVENLKKLRHLLPKGYTKTLAAEFEVPEATVSNTMLGRTRRFDIIERAVEMAEKNRVVVERLATLIERSEREV